MKYFNINKLILTSIRSRRLLVRGRIPSGGFTIIETLVAIAVLMIAISGPLVVASKGLAMAIYAKDQVIATNLAQETMEILLNGKDNNTNNGKPQKKWLDSMLDDTDCSLNYPCRKDYYKFNIWDLCSIGNCPVYFSETVGYVNSGGSNTKTKFDRYYYVTKTDHINACIKNVDTLCEIHVVVTWNEGTVPYDVTIVTEISSTDPSGNL